ncbi:hypothetical protein V5P93_002146 [Actinokineospora auranticolor]|uniref:alpha/beta fold hydrolase n=1 Tax=Actinokineospora auranticolor TaxID=155976 RepID=UPI000CEB8804|nr:hypothetical protein [Actinokineospora auranticolor]
MGEFKTVSVGAGIDLCYQRLGPVDALGLGSARQAVAYVVSGGRTARLRTITARTLVIHGGADRMCHPSGGRATAAAIPGAELVVIEGMGHDLPAALWPAARVADLPAHRGLAPMPVG